MRILKGVDFWLSARKSSPNLKLILFKKVVTWISRENRWFLVTILMRRGHLKLVNKCKNTLGKVRSLWTILSTFRKQMTHLRKWEILWMITWGCIIFIMDRGSSKMVPKGKELEKLKRRKNKQRGFRGKDKKINSLSIRQKMAQLNSTI